MAACGTKMENRGEKISEQTFEGNIFTPNLITRSMPGCRGEWRDGIFNATALKFVQAAGGEVGEHMHRA
jgi:hypothetical protein